MNTLTLKRIFAFDFMLQLIITALSCRRYSDGNTVHTLTQNMVFLNVLLFLQPPLLYNTKYIFIQAQIGLCTASVLEVLQYLQAP